MSPFAPKTISERAVAAWGWRRVRQPNVETRVWEAGETALERIGLHECRHTFASLMIAAGVNAKALSTYMGHANISITLDRYGHLLESDRDAVTKGLDRIA